MTGPTPECTRVYQNHHLDSTRWRHYRPHAGDVVITTSYKAGTTWTQFIVMGLLSPDDEALPNVHEVCPWPDKRFGQSDDEVAERLQARQSGKVLCLKSHLPLDGLPWHPQVRYIVVGRDPRDVFMSLYNHYRSYTEDAFARLNGGDRVGDPLPPCPGDPRDLWPHWIGSGWFEWEREGWPFWSNMGHTASYWGFRHLPNLLLVHYRDLERDPPGQIARIADFIGVDAGEALVRRVAERTRFDAVRRAARTVMPNMQRTFRGGSDTFFHKGGGGRWRGVLDDAALARYRETRDAVLEPGCARWLEDGGAVDGSSGP